MAEVWMDDYKELFYLHRPDLRVRPDTAVVYLCTHLTQCSDLVLVRGQALRVSSRKKAERQEQTFPLLTHELMFC